MRYKIRQVISKIRPVPANIVFHRYKSYNSASDVSTNLSVAVYLFAFAVGKCSVHSSSIKECFSCRLSGLARMVLPVTLRFSHDLNALPDLLTWPAKDTRMLLSVSSRHSSTTRSSQRYIGSYIRGQRYIGSYIRGQRYIGSYIRGQRYIGSYIRGQGSEVYWELQRISALAMTKLFSTGKLLVVVMVITGNEIARYLCVIMG